MLIVVVHFEIVLNNVGSGRDLVVSVLDSGLWGGGWTLGWWVQTPPQAWFAFEA